MSNCRLCPCIIPSCRPSPCFASPELHLDPWSRSWEDVRARQGSYWKRRTAPCSSAYRLHINKGSTLTPSIIPSACSYHSVLPCHRSEGNLDITFYVYLPPSRTHLRLWTLHINALGCFLDWWQLAFGNDNRCLRCQEASTCRPLRHLPWASGAWHKDWLAQDSKQGGEGKMRGGTLLLFPLYLTWGAGPNCRGFPVNAVSPGAAEYIWTGHTCFVCMYYLLVS